MRPLTLFACLAALAVGVAACGDEEPGVTEPAREGLALPLGGVDYNVFITRQLNPAIPPDDAYVEAAPSRRRARRCTGSSCRPATRPATSSRGTVEEFKVVDNQGNEFEPEELSEDNRFAYHARELEPKECIPEAGSVAQLGPTAGTMLLFRLPLQTTENRPLELEIEGEGDEHLTFELDI